MTLEMIRQNAESLTELASSYENLLEHKGELIKNRNKYNPKEYKPAFDLVESQIERLEAHILAILTSINKNIQEEIKNV